VLFMMAILESNFRKNKRDIQFGGFTPP
jgi:hypothetical protein